MLRKFLSLNVIFCFILTSLGPIPKAHADLLNLPAPGSMVNLSPSFEPALIKGITVHKDNPFLFDFILDTGNSGIKGDQLKAEGDRLVRYFFACLTIPEKDLWVNLSPYEKDKMVPQALGQTALGRDLLAQDYILKQLTASLIYPEKNLGKLFWDRVYAKARQEYGTTQIPVNTFNKVWIVADKAKVFEHGQTAFVINGHLKVMLEEDYLSLQKHNSSSVSLREAEGDAAISKKTSNDTHAVASQVIRQIVIPEIENEVNTGKNFSALRQIFNSLILATWYKNNLKEALLNQVYANKSTVKGVNLSDPSVKEQIYQQYIKAYKKGVFNYIKEDTQPNGQVTPKKYFSGGFVSNLAMTVEDGPDAAQAVALSRNTYDLTIGVDVNKAMTAQAVKLARESYDTEYAIGHNRPIHLPRPKWGTHSPTQLYHSSDDPFQVEATHRLNKLFKETRATTSEVEAWENFRDRFYFRNTNDLSTGNDAMTSLQLGQAEVPYLQFALDHANRFTAAEALKAVKVQGSEMTVEAIEGIFLFLYRQAIFDRFNTTESSEFKTWRLPAGKRADLEQLIGTASKAMTTDAWNLQISSNLRAYAQFALNQRGDNGPTPFSARQAYEQLRDQSLVDVGEFFKYLEVKGVLTTVGRIDSAVDQKYLLTRRNRVKLESAINAAMTALTLEDLNPDMREGVNELIQTFWGNHAKVQVLDRDFDKQRLLDEEIEAGKTTGRFIKLKDGNFFAQSHPKDVMRAPPRTMVSTNNPNDKGLHNNWHNEDELESKVIGLMKQDAKPTDTVYVLPYLRGPKGSPFSKVGVQITTDRQVALQIMTLYKVGWDAVEHLKESDYFTQGANIPGDLDELWSIIGNGGPDGRHFVAFLNKRKFLSRGSAYGGNAILPKKFELRQGMYDSVEAILNEGKVILSEHMFILQITEKKTGKKFHFLGAFPSASGKTNMGMIELPPELSDEYTAEMVSDDLSDIYQAVDPNVYTPDEIGHLFAHNPEEGIFGVIYGTGWESNSALMKSLKPNSDIIFTNVAINRNLGEVWWESLTKNYPPFDENAQYWEDWKGEKIIDRVVTQADVEKKYGSDKKLADLSPEELWELKAAKEVWAHANSRASVPMSNIVNLSPDFYNPKGVKVDAILWGGKNDHETLLRIIYDTLEGITDGTSAVAKSTAASEGKLDQLDADPNAQKPFFGSPEGRYFAAWLKAAAIVGDKMPIFAHINQIQPTWPGFNKNAHLLKLLIEFIKGNKDNFRRTALGYVPKESNFDLDNFINPKTKAPLTSAELTKLLGYDPYFWLYKEMPRREAAYDKIDAASPNNKVPQDLRDKNAEIVDRLKNEITLIDLGKVEGRMFNHPVLLPANGDEVSLQLLLDNEHPILDTSFLAVQVMINLAGFNHVFKLKIKNDGGVSRLIMYSNGLNPSEFILQMDKLKASLDVVRKQVSLLSTGEYAFSAELKEIRHRLFTAQPVVAHDNHQLSVIAMENGVRADFPSAITLEILNTAIVNAGLDKKLSLRTVKVPGTSLKRVEIYSIEGDEGTFKDNVASLQPYLSADAAMFSRVEFLKSARNQQEYFRRLIGLRNRSSLDEALQRAKPSYVRDPNRQKRQIERSIIAKHGQGVRSYVEGTRKDRAQVTPGGIDLNAANMGMTVSKDAQGGVVVNIDPAMIARIKSQGVFAADPFIIQIRPMNTAQISPLLGLQASAVHMAAA